MREAKRRKNFNLAARIMDIHHLRTVRPAPGKVKRPRKPRKNLFQIGRGTRDAASVPEQVGSFCSECALTVTNSTSEGRRST